MYQPLPTFEKTSVWALDRRPRQQDHRLDHQLIFPLPKLRFRHQLTIPWLHMFPRQIRQYQFVDLLENELCKHKI